MVCCTTIRSSSCCCLFPLFLVHLLIGSTCFVAEIEAQHPRPPVLENVNDFDSVDTDSNGSISKLEFEKWHHKVLPTTNSPDRSASIFSSYDLDGNGVLTVPEFVPVAFAVSRKADDEANKVFKQLDKNSDGILTQEELASSSSSNSNNSNENKSSSVFPEIIKGLFLVADSNADDKIDATEFKRAIQSLSENSVHQEKNEGIAQQLVLSIDVNKDKGIDRDELFEFAKQSNKISKLQTDSVFSQLDQNKDGVLSVAEVKRVPELLQKAIGILPMPPLN